MSRRALLILLASAGRSFALSPPSPPAAATTAGDRDGDGTTLTVYAAASLTKTFEAIGAEFEEQHDGVTVEFSFGGSSDLVAQIQEGAPADVFASADTANMDKLTAENLQATDPQNFASNTLEIAVPPDNPAGVASFADLAKDGVNVVVCAPEVPCGAATVKVEEATGVDIAAGQRGAVGHRRPGQGHLG